VTPSINWWCKSRDRKHAKSISVRNNRWNSQIARIFENVLVKDFHWVVYHRNVHRQNVSFRLVLDRVYCIFKKFAVVCPPTIQKWNPYIAPATHLGRYFYSGRLEKPRRQFRHKLVSGNFNITSLTGKKHWLVMKARRFILEVDGILSTKRCGSFPVELDHG